jgi:hypothetical protein
MAQKKKPAVKVTEFAAMWKTQRRTVYDWIDKGLPHRNEASGMVIPVADGNEWVVEFKTWDLQEARRKSDGAVPNEKTEAALERRAKRLLAENELLERTRKVIPVTTYTEVVDRVVGTFAGIARGRLRIFQRDVIRAKTPADAIKIFERMEHELMSGAQQYATQMNDEAMERQREAAIAAAEAKAAKEAAKAAEAGSLSFEEQEEYGDGE